MAAARNEADARGEPFRSARNLGNGALMVAVAAPWVAAIAWMAGRPSPGDDAPGLLELTPLSAEHVTAWSAAHPIALVNALFFVNVCVLFWIISLIQKSAWLIDPYWTLLPLLIGHTWQLHPAAETEPVRGSLAMGLVWLWSLRLTHNYFRREEWRFGWREDWRYAQMRRRHPKHWWWMSFFAVFVIQQAMLVGLCLPLYAVYTRDAPLTVLDGLAAIGCVAGLVIGHLGDTELRRFMVENERREGAGEPRRLVLDTGIWRWSRHPNYFGEQLFWWSLALFGVGLGMAWTVAGTVLNTLVLARVTVMTERRMLARPERADRYRAYQRRTSVWLPLPPRKA